jgi:lysophospholipase L1-like esterase
VLLTKLKNALPKCKIYVTAYYPITEGKNFQSPPGGNQSQPGGRQSPVGGNNSPAGANQPRAAKKMRTLPEIQEVNARLKVLAKELGVEFLDFNHIIAKDNGYLKDEYSVDGMHLTEDAYRAIFAEFKNYL